MSYRSPSTPDTNAINSYSLSKNGPPTLYPQDFFEVQKIQNSGFETENLNCPNSSSSLSDVENFPQNALNFQKNKVMYENFQIDPSAVRLALENEIKKETKFDEIQEKSSENNFDVLLLCFTKSSWSKHITCFLAILLSVFMIFMGLIFYHRCPLENSVPKFLLVGGIFFLILSFIFTVLDSFKIDFQNDYPSAASCIYKIIILFFATWFVYGNVIVIFKHKTNDFTILPSLFIEGCDLIVYFVAYAILASCYIIVAIVFVLVLSILIFRKVAQTFMTAKNIFSPAPIKMNDRFEQFRYSQTDLDFENFAATPNFDQRKNTIQV